MTAPDTPPSEDGLLASGEEPVLRLVRWDAGVDPDDPDAGYKQSVAMSGLSDPVATLRAAADNLGVPVGALARHVLAEWASAGANALLEVGPTVIDELASAADDVDAAPQGLARDAAWAKLRGRIQWLAHGVQSPHTTYPDGGGGTVRRRRVGTYGLAEISEHVLLVRVADGYPGAGRWTLPGGGLEHGEHPRDGLVREVTEETGLPAEVGDFLLTDSHHLVRGDRDLHLLRLVWRITVPTDRAPLPEEVGGSTAEAAWIAPDRLATLPLLSVATRAIEAIGLRAPRPDRRGGAV